MTPDKRVEEIVEIRKTIKETLDLLGTPSAWVDVGIERICYLYEQTLTQYHQDMMSEVLPFLKAYEQVLECDWSINPVQATSLVYRSPESVLRDSADDIERKREMLSKLKIFIKSLSK